MKKKIYLAGSGGMLGESFYKVLSNNYNVRASDLIVNDKWLNYLDFREIFIAVIYIPVFLDFALS